MPLEKGKGRVWVLTNEKLGSEKDELRIVSIGITDGMLRLGKPRDDKARKLYWKREIRTQSAKYAS